MLLQLFVFVMFLIALVVLNNAAANANGWVATMLRLWFFVVVLCMSIYYMTVLMVVLWN